jgi:bifunctional non-homologous end joining protein LigD
VLLDKKTGMPSFQDHQRRMNVDNSREIEILSAEMPVTYYLLYYLFDILYLDGRNLQALPLLERRRILSKIVKKVQE